jgi:hypothetical protein
MKWLLSPLAILWVVAAGCTRGDGSVPVDAQSDVIHVVVREEGAPLREAEVRCIGSVTGTGFLSTSEAAGAACATAEVSPPVAEFFDFGSDGRCNKFIGAWKSTARTRRGDGSATFDGTYNGDTLARKISTEDECGAALWGLLEPVLFPSSKPLVVNYRTDSTEGSGD